jgi:antirestriction protein ArdC
VSAAISRRVRANPPSEDRAQGINVLMVWLAANNKGYTSPFWMTLRQTLESKAKVRKGEHDF